MKKLLLALVAFFALSFGAFAAVDLNTATKEELDTVKGIGPVKAQAIVDYRKKNGPFKSVDDLKNVKGFGEKTVAKMRSDLTVGGAAASVADKKEAKPAKDDTKNAKADTRPAKDDAKGAKTDGKPASAGAAKDAKAGADSVKQSKAEKKAAKKKAKEEKKAAKAKAKEDKKAADKK